MESSRSRKKTKTAPLQLPVDQPSRISRYIDNGLDLEVYSADLHNRGVEVIALDLEGDQGNIRYAYSISILQCFDGKETVIIDVLKMGSKPALRHFLTDPAIVKIMFSCANDIFMTQNVLGCTISPVLDIAVGQRLLDLPIGISEHLNTTQKLKKTFQRANWLTRPISHELLDYAISDVVDLFTIEHRIASQLERANLIDVYREASARFSDKDYRIDQMQHYKAKFPNYDRLRPKQRRAAAVVWVFRELIGKHFNCPVGYVLSKQAMTACIRDSEHLMSCLERELNRGRSEKKRIRKELVEKCYQEALRITGDDPGVHKRGAQ